MMSYPVLIAWNVGLVWLAWALAKKNRWLALIPVPIAALFALGAVDILRDAHFRPAVIHELGYSYIALGFVPLLAIIVVAVTRKKPNKAPEPTPGLVTPRALE